MARLLGVGRLAGLKEQRSFCFDCRGLRGRWSVATARVNTKLCVCVRVCVYIIKRQLLCPAGLCGKGGGLKP